jgi:hypothetical protein
MDATMNCEVPDTFYWAEEGGDSDVEEKGLTTSEVLQCFCFGKKRGRAAPVSEEERNTYMTALVLV